MHYQIRYCSRASDELVKVLEENKIPFKRISESYATVSYDDLVYTIVKSDETADLLKYVDTIQLGTAYASFEYSQQDLDDAEWIYMRSVSGKVPTSDKINNYVYCGSRTPKLCWACQRKEVMYARPMKWKKNTAFCSSYELGYTEFFCSETAKKVMESEKFPIAYYVVLNEKNSEVIPEIYYFEPINKLPMEAIDFSDMRIQSSCKTCGQTTWMLQDQDRLRIYRQYLDETCGIYATPRIWGPQGARSAIIISQRVYRFIREHRMDRSMRFVPVVLE